MGQELIWFIIGPTVHITQVLVLTESKERFLNLKF